MPSAVPLRTDFSARELRRLAKQSQDSNQSRRLLSLAAVLDEVLLLNGITVTVKVAHGRFYNVVDLVDRLEAESRAGR